MNIQRKRKKHRFPEKSNKSISFVFFFVLSVSPPQNRRYVLDSTNLSNAACSVKYNNIMITVFKIENQNNIYDSTKIFLISIIILFLFGIYLVDHNKNNKTEEKNRRYCRIFDHKNMVAYLFFYESFFMYLYARRTISMFFVRFFIFGNRCTTKTTASNPFFALISFICRLYHRSSYFF